MAHQVRRLEDAAALRAFAHPLRQELYERLVLQGPLTASELADLVGESPANCSWHLRKLAEHGLVEEAAGGTGRRRPWQVTAQGLRWREDADDDEAARAGSALTRMLVDRERSRLDHGLERLRGDEPRWRDAASVTQSLVWLTAEELAEVNRVLAEIALRHVERFEDPGSRPPGARLCAYLAWAVPTYDVLPATPGTEPVAEEDAR